jgi:hypothetical protein
MRQQVESELAQIVDYNVVPLYPHVVEIFGTSEPLHVLLRPDNHVAMITREASVENALREIRGYLNDVIGQA